ncbi:unnamed protein product [Gordionus sp. m RMFG-2023]
MNFDNIVLMNGDLENSCSSYSISQEGQACFDNKSENNIAKEPSLKFEINFQKLNKFDSLLPYYYISLTPETITHWKWIKLNLVRALKNDDFRPGVLHWSNQIYLYILRHGLRFNKADHILLIELLYQLVTDSDMDLDIVNQVILVLIELLRKRECLVRNLDLTIDLQPLFRLYKWVVIDREDSDKTDYGMTRAPKHFGRNLSNLIKFARVYFHSGSWSILRQKLNFPYLSPFDGKRLEQATHMLELFSPTIFCSVLEFKTEILPNEVSEIQDANNINRVEISKLGYLGDLIAFYCSYENFPAWDRHLIALFARVAENNIGSYDWPPTFVELFFTKFLANLNLPISGMTVGYRSDHFHKMPIYETAKWMVYSIKGTFDEKPVTDKRTIADTVQPKLITLLSAIESYLHPSNFGKWTGILVKFVNSLVVCFVDRIYFERRKVFKWESIIPNHAKLSDEQCQKFVSSLEPIIFLLIFDKKYYRNITLTIKSLISLSAITILPPLMVKIFSAFETVLEPHRLRSCLAVASVLALPLTTNLYQSVDLSITKHNDYAYLFALLKFALVAIDANDSIKCASSLLLISALTSLIPIAQIPDNSIDIDDQINDLVDDQNGLNDHLNKSLPNNFQLSNEAIKSEKVPLKAVAINYSSNDIMDYKNPKSLKSIKALANKPISDQIPVLFVKKETPILSKTSNNDLIRISLEAGPFFKEFIINLLDKCFNLADSMDNSCMDNGGSGYNSRDDCKGFNGSLQLPFKSLDETSLSFAIMSALETVLRQCSPEIYESAVHYSLDRMKNILYSSKPARDAISDLCLGLCIADPSISLPIILPFFAGRLTQCLIERQNLQNQSNENPQMDEPELLWYSQILASSLRNTGTKVLIVLAQDLWRFLKAGLKVESIISSASSESENLNNHPFLTPRIEVFEILGECLSNLMSSLTKIYIQDYKSLNPQEWKTYTMNKKLHNPFQYWGKLYKHNEVKLDWHEPSPQGLELTRSLLDHFLSPCLAYIDHWVTSSHKNSSSHQNTCHKEVLRRCLCIVEKCLIGCGAVLEPIYKCDLNYNSTHEEEPFIKSDMIDKYDGLAYPFISTIFIKDCDNNTVSKMDNEQEKNKGTQNYVRSNGNKENGIVDGLESVELSENQSKIHYQNAIITRLGFHKLRSRIAKSVRALLLNHLFICDSSQRPKLGTGEDYISLNYLISIYRLLLFYRGYFQTDIDSKCQTYKQAKVYFGDRCLAYKRCPRFARALRAQIQHEILCNKHLNTTFTLEHQKMTIDLTRVAVWVAYKGVRDSALNLLDDILSRWNGSAKALLITQLQAFVKIQQQSRIVNPLSFNGKINETKSKGENNGAHLESDQLQAPEVYYKTEKESGEGHNNNDMGKLKTQLDSIGQKRSLNLNLKSEKISTLVEFDLETHKLDSMESDIDIILVKNPENRNKPSVNKANDKSIFMNHDIRSTMHLSYPQAVSSSSYDSLDPEALDRASEAMFALILGGKGGILSDNCLGGTNQPDEICAIWRLLFEIHLPEKVAVIDLYDDCVDTVLGDALINLKRHYLIPKSIDLILERVLYSENYTNDEINSCNKQGISHSDDFESHYPVFKCELPLAKPFQENLYHYRRISSSHLPACSYLTALQNYLLNIALPSLARQNWRYLFVAIHMLGDVIFFHETPLTPDLTRQFFSATLTPLGPVDDSPLVRLLYLGNCVGFLKLLKKYPEYSKRACLLSSSINIISENFFVEENGKIKQTKMVENTGSVNVQINQLKTEANMIQCSHFREKMIDLDSVNRYSYKNNKLYADSEIPHNLDLDMVDINSKNLEKVNNKNSNKDSSLQRTVNMNLVNDQIFIHKRYIGYTSPNNPLFHSSELPLLLNLIDYGSFGPNYQRENSSGFVRPYFECAYSQNLINSVSSNDNLLAFNKHVNVGNDYIKSSIHHKRKECALEIHRIVYETTCSRPLIDGFLSKMAASEDTDIEFDLLRVNFFKGLFRNNGPILTRVYMDYLEERLWDAKTPINSKPLSLHCIAAEIFAGWIRASKYWPMQHSVEFFLMYRPFIDGAILKALTPENYKFWRSSLAYVCINRDPNHLHWLLEHLVAKCCSFFPLDGVEEKTKRCVENEKAEKERDHWSTLNVSLTLKLTIEALDRFHWRIGKLHDKLARHIYTFFVGTKDDSDKGTDFYFNGRSKNLQIAIGGLLALPFIFADPYGTNVNGGPSFSDFFRDTIVPNIVLHLQTLSREPNQSNKDQISTLEVDYDEDNKAQLSSEFDNSQTTKKISQISQISDLSPPLLDHTENPFSVRDPTEYYINDLIHTMTEKFPKSSYTYLNFERSKILKSSYSSQNAEKSENSFKTFLKLLNSLLQRSAHPLIIPEMAHFLPCLFYLEKRIESRDPLSAKEMAAAHIFVSRCVSSRTYLSTDENSILCSLAAHFIQCPLRKARASALSYLGASIFCDSLFKSPNYTNSPLNSLQTNNNNATAAFRFCLAGLADPALEVRERARDTLSGLLRCKYLPFNNVEDVQALVRTLTDLIDLDANELNKEKRVNQDQNVFYSVPNCYYDPPHLLSQVVQLLSPTNDIELNQIESPIENKINYNFRSAGILGLCAIVEAFPYDIPPALPSILVKLSHLSHTSFSKKLGKIGTGAQTSNSQLIRQTMANFKRTHQDNWHQDHRAKFTDEELEILADLLGGFEVKC